ACGVSPSPPSGPPLAFEHPTCHWTMVHSTSAKTIRFTCFFICSMVLKVVCVIFYFKGACYVAAVGIATALVTVINGTGKGALNEPSGIYYFRCPAEMLVRALSVNVLKRPCACTAHRYAEHD